MKNMENQLSQLRTEERVKIEKERTISDAQLLKDNAEYNIGGNGESVLVLTENQVERAKLEMEGIAGLREKFVENCLVAMENLENFDQVFVSGRSDFEYSSPFILEKQEDGEYLLKDTKTDRDCAEGPYAFIVEQKRYEEERQMESMLGKYWDKLDIDSKKYLATKGINHLLEVKRNS